MRNVAPCIGTGDILSLVEKAESNIKEGEAEAMTKRLMEAKFDFNDFLSQYKMLNNMGSMGSIMKMLPGTSIASQESTYSILIDDIVCAIQTCN